MIQHLPINRLTAFEGGEMWKQISTVGYEDIIVEFDLEADLNSDYPHGFAPWEIGWGASGRVRSGRINALFRPYERCRRDRESDPEVFWDDYERCPTAGLMEELFIICYTADYDEPFKENGDPAFFDLSSLNAKGITHWTMARVIPREVLRTDFTSSATVRLDFSMHDETDNIDDFGIWFRSVLDDPLDEIKVDNIRIYGKKIPTP